MAARAKAVLLSVTGTVLAVFVLGLLFISLGGFSSRTSAEETAAQPAGQAQDQASAQDDSVPAPAAAAKKGDKVTWPLAPMTLGDPKAPVTIEEFSSFGCGHCGQFHREVFDTFKERYIDTGKVHYIFHEFPLNKPALDAAVLARCLPEARYWGFSKLLFETQSTWAYGGDDYLDKLRQNAKLAGLSDASMEACLKSEKTAKALASGIELAQKTYAVNATPTFVFNYGETKLVGEQSLDLLSKAVDALIKSRDGNTAQ